MIIKKSVFISIFMLMVVHCSTPPSGWKSRSSLYGNGDSISGSITRDLSGIKKGGKSEIRVQLYTGKPLEIECNKQYEFITATGQKKRGTNKFMPASTGEFISSDNQFRLQKRQYSGRLKIISQGTTFSYINYVNIDHYLVSVVGHEMSPSWPVEALKAQAVVARTYVLKKKLNSVGKNYDIGNDTYDQVYGGMIQNDGNVTRAVRETVDQVIMYEGKIAEVFFHSDCGGETAAASEIWQEDYPYLVRKKCDFKESPEYKWEVSYNMNDMKKLLGYQNLTGISVGERSASKRIKDIMLSAGGTQKKIPISEFRKQLGVDKVKSSLFGIKKSSDGYTIKGRGYGHGVGLCQWCAKIMVEKKSQRYNAIISFFFPGTRIEKI